MRFSLIMHAPAGDAFASGAFDTQLGTEVQFRAQSGRPTYTGILVAAEVIEDGHAARIMLDLPDDCPLPVDAHASQDYSIGYTP
jgi:hypothetical protein